MYHVLLQIVCLTKTSSNCSCPFNLAWKWHRLPSTWWLPAAIALFCLLSVVSIAPFLVLFCGATVDTLKMVSRLCQAPLTVDRRWVRSLALDGVRSTDSQCLTVHQRILSYQLSSSINIVDNKKEMLGHSFCCLSTELQQMPNAISLIVSACV